jgi:hypothetical protein
MKIKDLFEEDLSNAVPYKQMTQVKKLIKKGAMDDEHTWANALDLVHRAYEVASVQRPTPSMEDAWAQYEEAIEYAVKELQKATDKGVRDDSWKSQSTKLEKEASNY